MKKINTTPISGMQELLPEAQATFNRLKEIISNVYHAHGFLSIETPTIDRAEILLAKAGGDTEKQIYKVVKTAESMDEADQALRFDHTVPLARYVVEHENDLAFPFKVTQIGRNFRGERPQKGRFREFYQCDVDVIGRGDLSVAYDADVISTLLDAFSKFGLKTPVLARLNNRKIVSGLLEALELNDKADAVFGIIDHSEKVPAEATESALTEEGIDDEKRAKIVDFINMHGDRDTIAAGLSGLGIENETFQAGVDELLKVMDILGGISSKDQFEADMKIVRGLDYYTGTVFEFILPEYKWLGSVCGGGRYENLAGYFTEQALPGVGGSIGLTRLFYVLGENQLISGEDSKSVDFAIVPLTENEVAYAFSVADELRGEGNSTTVVLSDKKFGDKMKYAARVASKCIVIGEDEVKSGKYDIKEFV